MFTTSQMYLLALSRTIVFAIHYCLSLSAFGGIAYSLYFHFQLIDKPMYSIKVISYTSLFLTPKSIILKKI